MINLKELGRRTLRRLVVIFFHFHDFEEWKTEMLFQDVNTKETVWTRECKTCKELEYKYV